MLSRSLAFFFQVIWVLHLVRNSWSFQIQGGFIEALDGALQVMFDHPPSKPPVDQPTNPANLVFAHHMVGNTYSYDIGMWMADIILASSKGIDAFALNIGRDTWEPDQVANAYAAAKSLGSPLKLFFSFDMSSLPCSSRENAGILQMYIRKYANHPNQMLYNGSVLVSTFAGEQCTFGSSSLNDGWRDTLKVGLPPVYFVPSLFVDPNTFSELTVMDGAFSWNSAWPMGNYDIDFSYDQNYLSNLGPNRSYMAGVAPWFFTHYGKDTYNKNFIYRGDDWLFADRWESLIANRSVIPFAEVITWNDYGESSYVGPIHKDQPMSHSWVDGFDHQGWLDLMAYYISAFKTGSYPPITKDRIFLWGRLYPTDATAEHDNVGKPDHWEWTQDYLWAIILLTEPADITLTCGQSTQTSSLPPGLSKLKLPLTSTSENPSCDVVSSIYRSSSDSRMTFEPVGFRFGSLAKTYNFNAFVAASPA